MISYDHIEIPIFHLADLPYYDFLACFIFPGRAVVVGVTMYVLSISSLSEVEMVL